MRSKTRQPKKLSILAPLLTLIMCAPFLMGGACGEEITAPPPQTAQTWTVTFGGPTDEIGRDVVALSDGACALGSTNSPGVDAEDIFLIRVNDSGRALWQNTYGGAGADIAYALVATDDGGFITAGTTTSSGAGGVDAHVIKIDNAGVLLWDSAYGGGSDDQGYDIIKSSDGAFLICGSSVSLGVVFSAGYLLKIDANGNTLWEKAYRGTLSDRHLYAISSTPSGGYIMVGESIAVTTGWSTMMIIIVDSAGTMITEKFYAANTADRGNDVAQTADGGFLIVGTTDSPGLNGFDAFMMKVDQNGDSLLYNVFNNEGPDRGHAVIPDGSGHLIMGEKLAGSTTNLQMHLQYVDASGSVFRSRTYGGIGFESGQSIARAPDGGLYLIGTTESSGAGSKDVYLLKTTAAGGL